MASSTLITSITATPKPAPLIRPKITATLTTTTTTPTAAAVAATYLPSQSALYYYPPSRGRRGRPLTRST
ncbi:hypothetical protein PHJA_000257000 [Phtheirospermum japonicum]|uniref:Uncharacterized protein n=1 Tax=Phtheirospermum japonicum TaxID=374723 RepID=A0A830B208_9LAMI|nr:hypothetical protein PHJA_000257000 [Phtheirospermum japonicum]